MMKNIFKRKNAVYKDAKTILDSIDEEIMQSCWDIYAHIQKAHPEQYDGFDEDIYNVLTYTWQGLKKLVEYEGDFFKFTEEEKHYLVELRDGHTAYYDLIHTLIDHHDDEVEAEYIFELHPRLHRIIPQEYDTAKQVIEVLIEMVRDYQWQLEHFSMKHYGEIDAALGIEHTEDEKELYVLPE